MKQQNFWLKALNVREEEGWLVRKLFLLQFFQGAGISFFFTAGFALFLSKFPITELPYVFIIAAVFLWITGLIYSKIEHRFQIGKLAIGITIFMIVSMVAFRLAFAFVQSDWFLYYMLAWFNVLYLLNNLEFWGVASLSFDVRQSKRLFGVISAGDIPAKFIGYSLALLLVSIIGTINLLWIGIVCMAASIPYLISIQRSGKLVTINHHHHPSANSSEGLSKIIKEFSENILIRRLSLLSIIITGSFIIINYEFYAGVKEAYHDDVSLARFIAFFLAIVRVVALFVKMIFTGRLINNLGIVKSLLITPVVLFVLLIAIIITQNLPETIKATVYLFGATYIVVDILRSAINSPVFLTIMQPLSNHERLRAHTILKGIMDPFASLFSGVLILILIRYQHEVKLVTLSYILMALCVFWIIGIFRVNSEYLKTIIKSISSRYFVGENFSVNDSGTLDWLKEKAKKGTELEVINILNMLYDSTNEMSEDLLEMALKHPSEKVKMATLALIQQKNFPAAPTYLAPFLKDNSSTSLVAETIKILCRNGVDSSIIVPYLENTEGEIRVAALSGLFFYGSPESQHQTGSIIRQMMASADSSKREMVAKILSTQDKCNEPEMILQLMQDTDAAVRKTAFLAAGKSGDDLLLNALMQNFEHHQIAVMEPLFVAGNASLPFINTFINSDKATTFQKEKLIALIGRKGGVPSQKLLFGLLKTHLAQYNAILKALYRSNFKPSVSEQPILSELVNKLLVKSAGLLHMQAIMQQNHEKYQLVINSLALESNSLRQCLLYLFGILYNRESIKRVRTAFATGKKESIINAMEIIDATVRKDFAIAFNTIFEPGHFVQRMHELKKIYPAEKFKTAVQILNGILEDETLPYNNWTLACALYTSKKQGQKIDYSLIKKYTLAENIFVRETANYAL